MKLGPVLPFLLVLGLLASCAAQRPRFEKPGVTEAEQKRDQAECAKLSMSVVGARLGFGVFKIDRDTYQSCLKSRGYRDVNS